MASGSAGVLGRRWLVSILVLIGAIATGWYVGTRVGSGGTESRGQAEQAGQDPDGKRIYRNIAGRVVRVDAGAGELRVDHDEIDGLMGAMVMDLDVVEPRELAGLNGGDKILFDLVGIGSSYKAIRIRPFSGTAGEAGHATAIPENPLDRGDIMPDLALIGADGRGFRLHEMQSRHKIITFFYARCPVREFCPAQSESLARLQRHLESSDADVHLLSLTLDGEHDSTGILSAYAERVGADAGRWTIAGGEDPEAIREFAHRAGARIGVRPDSYEIDHALIGLRIDGNRIVDRVYGLEGIDKMVRGMRIARAGG
jgi:cytochrome oxidase Cu insertion factor (SCO1/SenC/PrrC family)/Cu/Ag efflux protein CusF